MLEGFEKLTDINTIQTEKKIKNILLTIILNKLSKKLIYSEYVPD